MVYVLQYVARCLHSVRLSRSQGIPVPFEVIGVGFVSEGNLALKLQSFVCPPYLGIQCLSHVLAKEESCCLGFTGLGLPPPPPVGYGGVPSLRPFPMVAKGLVPISSPSPHVSVKRCPSTLVVVGGLSQANISINPFDVVTPIHPISPK